MCVKWRVEYNSNRSRERYHGTLLLETDGKRRIYSSGWIELTIREISFFSKSNTLQRTLGKFCLFLISWVNSRSLHNIDIKKIVYKENIKLFSRLLSIFYHINKNEFIALRMKNNVRLPLFRVNFIKWASPFFSFMIRTRQNAHHVHYYTFLLFLNRYHRKCNWIIA